MKSFFAFICITILICIVFAPSAVYADTDGSYCIGQGYVAAEARGIWLKAEEPAIYIIFVGSGVVSDRVVIDSPANRNRFIHCEADRIIISDGNVIDLSNRQELRVMQNLARPATEFREDLLPYVRESKALSIPSLDKNYRYTLVLSHVEEASSSRGGILHHVSARVVQKDKSGNLIEAKLLTEGIRLETVD